MPRAIARMRLIFAAVAACCLVGKWRGMGDNLACCPIERKQKEAPSPGARPGASAQPRNRYRFPRSRAPDARQLRAADARLRPPWLCRPRRPGFGRSFRLQLRRYGFPSLGQLRAVGAYALDPPCALCRAPTVGLAAIPNAALSCRDVAKKPLGSLADFRGCHGGQHGCCPIERQVEIGTKKGPLVGGPFGGLDAYSIRMSWACRLVGSGAGARPRMMSRSWCA